LSEKYGVRVTFNAIDLTPFVGSTDNEVETIDLRTNHLQEGGHDSIAPNKRLTIRTMARRIQEE